MVPLQIIRGIATIIGLAFLLTVTSLAPLAGAVLAGAALVVALDILVRGRERALAKGTLGGLLLREAKRLRALSWLWTLLLLGLIALVVIAAWYVLPAMGGNPL